ncbi:tripartite tricarboxylate transporter substrate binding protein [Bradyrhizobium sp. LHD-71]|uniref:Bug family tripartite tricarboxylate transporter substrate binding protein n=1 Tax=Bradyrhizobium sp. LHD-71 TaxID=3072141 RepID=UPI00280E50AB|nr:tripartite tricarboxylate transporter substrate binding protein [Bradyrhizobium sp. LHD-71]MDQ8727786.1 tripartite tricarboxylate transporter substrate binding protein [Bradyrhizobium sp. LHD-71]
MFCIKHALIVVALVMVGATPAQSKDWPSRPVTIIVPFVAGGSTDIVARLMAERFRAEFNSAFVIENRPGATGNIGAVAAAKAAPDGHTLLFSTSGPVATNVLLFKTLQANPLTDLAPIALIAEVPLFVVVNAKLPIHNLKELLDYDKANPGKLNFGHAGTGSMGHMASELFAETAGRKFTSIVYQGSPAVTRDLVAGVIDVAFDLVPSYMPFIQAGTVRAIAVATSQRMPELADVPTVMEQGFKNFEASSFVALLGPANMPQEIVQKLNAVANAWLQEDASKKALQAQTLHAIGGTPEKLKERMRAEIRKWEPVVKSAGISLGN